MSFPLWTLSLFLPATHGHLRKSTYAEGSTSLAVHVPVNKLSNVSNVSNVSNITNVITPRSKNSLRNATGEKDAVSTGSEDSAGMQQLSCGFSLSGESPALSSDSQTF